MISLNIYLEFYIILNQFFFLDGVCPSNYIEAQGDIEASVEIRKTYGTFFSTCTNDCDELNVCTAFAYKKTSRNGRNSGTCIFFEAVRPTPKRLDEYLFCKKIESPCKVYH